MEWIASLGGKVQPKTIKSYLCHVRSLHVDSDVPFLACESPMVQRLIRGIKRYHGERDRNPKLPITAPILLRILDHLVDTTTEPVMLRGAFTSAFAGFLRCGEFTLKAGERFDPAIHLTKSSVKFFPDIDNATYVEITLPASKTDPFRKGVCIILAAAPGRASCPVDALRAIFRADPGAARDSPLFCRPGTGEPLRRKFFIDALQSTLRASGFDARFYSGHSFRRGAAFICSSN